MIGLTEQETLAEPIPLTDMGNAERLASEHGADVRYSHARKKWFVFQGDRWSVDESGEVYRRMKQVARGIYAEASLVADSASQKQVCNWARQSQSRARIESALKLAESEQPIPLDYRNLDSDPWLLNCSNGTVELRDEIVLRPHRRADFLTMTTGIDFPESSVEPKLWLETLNCIHNGNQQLIDFLQRLWGMALVGEVFEHILVVAHGVGANGKSVTWEAVRNVFGDYGMSASDELLMSVRNQSHSTVKADLMGMRLVVATETEDGAKLNEATVKRLTGGDNIRARRICENNIEFPPSHLMAMATNHRPQVKGTDNGIWRRLRVIPYEVVIPPDKQDRRLSEKLRAEYPAILRWIAEGCIKWQQSGLKEPECVMVATEGYRREQDILGQFIDDRCLVGTEYRVKCSQLYDAYKQWSKDSGEKAIGSRKFKEDMEIRRFQHKKSGTNWFLGITLNE